MTINISGRAAVVLTLLVALVLGVACSTTDNSAPVSRGGVQQANVSVETDSDGHTVEQNNIAERVKRDNHKGSIKHLYVISPMSGQVLLYSTVKGKVTSSGKRLTPLTVANGYNSNGGYGGIPFKMGDSTFYTGEVIQDDGTYGSSIPYLFWFDAQGRYHQHYIAGAEILHISDEPISVKGVIINLETKAE